MELTVKTTIDRPRHAVFESFCDLRQHEACRSSIEHLDIMSCGVFGVGTHWRETRRIRCLPGSHELWVTRIEPGRLCRVEGEEHGIHYQSEWRFEDAMDPAGSTQVTMVIVGTPLTRGARALEWLGERVRRVARQRLFRDLEDMRSALEHRRPT